MRLMRGDRTDDVARNMYRPPSIGYVKPPDPVHDGIVRNMAGREIEADVLRHLNRRMLLHGSLISGRPGYDYSNPSAFLTRLYINKPTLQTDRYGGGSQTPDSIAVNVAAGNRSIKKRW